MPTSTTTDDSESSSTTSTPSSTSTVKKQRIIVIKYFEESDKYAKIIPRTAVHILKRRLKQEKKNDVKITYEQVKQLTHITGRDVISLIKSDQSDWLHQYNPIQAVMLFNQNHNRFIQVTSEMQFAIPKAENIFTFHVKRKVKVDRLIGQRYCVLIVYIIDAFTNLILLLVQ
jgi:hypothetical protein